MTRICLLTPGQPSTNPRLLKEADALIEAGHEVEVICARWAAWADETDRALLQSRRFACTYVGGDREHGAARYAWTRLRHKAGRWLAPRLTSEAVHRWALCRVTPELTRAAERRRADLYIAHNLGALPAAVAAARRNGAKAAFDAEDFHSGMRPDHEAPSFMDGLIEETERRCLGACDYVTAASPLIAQAYKTKYGIAEPTTLLNVFPLALRPRAFRTGNPAAPLTLYWFSQTIGENRGLEDVIRALGRLKDCDIKLHLLGDWQPGFRQRLLSLAESMGARHKAIVSHPPQSPDAMIEFASQFDIGLALELPQSLNRDLCLTNKIFTYLLAGNAVIATNTQGQRQIVSELGEAAAGYQAGDANRLAAILKGWYKNRASLELARQRAWRLAEQRYSWDIEKQKFLNEVSRVLDPASQCEALAVGSRFARRVEGDLQDAKGSVEPWQRF